MRHIGTGLPERASRQRRPARRGGIDTLNGGDGLDFLEGDSGSDILIGGPGGVGCFSIFVACGDSFSGDSGNDIVLFRDGSPDEIARSTCGSGTDRVDIDLADATIFAFGQLNIVSFMLGSGCENVTVGAVNEGPNVKISRRSPSVGTDGRATVRLRCPGSLTAPCAGTLRLGHSPKSQGKRTHYSIDQGKKDNVSASLSRRDRRRLRRHGEATALVTSVEQGQFGDKTTVQTIKLIAQD